MNKLTIQINNLEALERLIGGDSEVEVDIRNSVVQKFTEKHLKALATSGEVVSVMDAIKRDISRQIQEKVEAEIGIFKASSGWGSSATVTLRSEIKNEIDRHVRSITDKKIQDTVDAAITYWLNESELEKRIDTKFEYYTTDHINSEIRSRIEKLKAKL